MRIDARRPHVHVVRVESLRRQGHELEHLVDAHRTYDSVRRRHGGNNVLDDAHRLHVGDALDVELGRALGRDVEEPLHVVRRIGVDGPLVRFWPLDELRVADAVLRQSRCFRDGAEWIRSLRREGVQRTLEARRESRNDDSRLAPKTFRTPINHGYDLRRIYDVALIIHFRQADEHGVEPPSRFDVVQSATNHVESRIKVRVLVLDLAHVCDHITLRHAFSDELGGDLGLRPSDVFLSK
mmetsp:Transcript_12425/g.36430  ORF Transcript_12425/g.36430 Transcript_12425/m.36430 type:complete len:239 (+) Transcript_12425:374-1090(+)